jgi:hypothetical protein
MTSVRHCRSGHVGTRMGRAQRHQTAVPGLAHGASAHAGALREAATVRASGASAAVRGSATCSAARWHVHAAARGTGSDRR